MSQVLLWLKTTGDKTESKKANKARFCTVEINCSTILQSAIIDLPTPLVQPVFSLEVVTECVRFVAR